MSGFKITVENENATVGAKTFCYTPVNDDVAIQYYYHSSESKFESLAQTNGTDSQMEFLRSLKKSCPAVFEKVSDYLDSVRLDLGEEDIKELLKV